MDPREACQIPLAQQCAYSFRGVVGSGCPEGDVDVFLCLLLPFVVVFLGQGQRGLPRGLDPNAGAVDLLLLHVLDVLVNRGGDVQLVPVRLSFRPNFVFGAS